MKMSGWFVAGISATVVSVGLFASQIEAQERPEFPLAPVPRHGNFVAPYFDGFFVNEDGTKTYSFGFMNRNDEDLIEIPLGPDNFITPEQYDGVQPTHFPVVSYGGFGGPRERGTFSITVPADFTDDVVWTLRSPNGTETFVPGRSTSVAYELGMTPQAAGSMRPYVRFSPDGEPGWGPTGVYMEETLSTAVGTPLAITYYAEDRGERDLRPVNTTWQVHQGPVGATTTFDPASLRFASEGGEILNEGTIPVTFDTPGAYVLRVRVDNFGAGDSGFGNMCCWSNGYVRVNVTE